MSLFQQRSAPGVPAQCAPIVFAYTGSIQCVARREREKMFGNTLVKNKKKIIRRSENMALNWHRKCAPVAVMLADWSDESITGCVSGPC